MPGVPCPRQYPDHRDTAWAKKLGYFTDTELATRDKIYAKVFSAAEAPYDNQEEALLGFIRGKDVLVLTPTNSGKSRIFVLILFWCLESDPGSIIIVIYPLLGLEKEEVQVILDLWPDLKPIFFDVRGDT